MMSQLHRHAKNIALRKHEMAACSMCSAWLMTLRHDIQQWLSWQNRWWCKDMTTDYGSPNLWKSPILCDLPSLWPSPLRKLSFQRKYVLGCMLLFVPLGSWESERQAALPDTTGQELCEHFAFKGTTMFGCSSVLHNILQCLGTCLFAHQQVSDYCKWRLSAVI